MALLAMAIHDTPENGRDRFTKETLESLAETVDFSKHRVCLVVNAATDNTIAAVQRFKDISGCKVLMMPENVGTARAINQAWKFREPGENAIKMDNDVVIHQAGWVEILEDCISLDSKIGIIGLKRKDCIESPWRDDQYKSHIKMLPHELGWPWRIVEVVNHVMGTCQMYNSDLLDKIGYLYQPRLYGFDDSLAAVRCKVAGFYSCFYSSIEIDHIDPGDNPYQKWKEKVADEDMNRYNEIKEQYRSGRRPVWCDADYQ